MSTLQTIPSSRPMMGTEECEYVRAAMCSAQLAGSKREVERFEACFAQLLEVDPASVVAVSSGTAALTIALQQMCVPGAKVATSPLGFFATVEAILAADCHPVFVDVDGLGQLSPEQLELALDTQDIAAVVPVHLYGHMSGHMDRILAMCAARGVRVIEDACQAHGATYKDLAAGTLGEAGCYSFYATKHITTLGEGGAIVTRNAYAAEAMREARAHGMSDARTHVRRGGNHRMSEAAAACGVAQIARFRDTQQNRSQMCREICAAITHDDVYPVLCDPPASSAWFWLPVAVSPYQAIRRTGRKGRSSVEPFRKHMASLSIETRYRYDRPLFDQPVIRALYGVDFVRRAYQACPAATEIAQTVVGLPTCADMTTEERDRIIDAVNSFQEQ